MDALITVAFIIDHYSFDRRAFACVHRLITERGAFIMVVHPRMTKMTPKILIKTSFLVGSRGKS